MSREEQYTVKRIIKGKVQSIPFYLFRIFPIKKKKIVFCCIEGTTGYSCNPKYIAEEMINRKDEFEMIWLVNDITKQFPKEIKVVKNSLWNRAYQLATAKIWIDNSRKQLEVRKRKNQIYIQTWHAKLGFKPTCLDRGHSFSKIAYLISKHDSEMIDYVLSNSKWYDDTLPSGMMYTGLILRYGSPRCDILVNRVCEMHRRIREIYNLPENAKIVLYAPTFRGGSQGTDRRIRVDESKLDYDRLVDALRRRFGGKWYVMLRLHPQLVARQISNNTDNNKVIDVSKEEDLYEILAGCDAFITDYSSAAFDAAVMRIPVFLYCDDYSEYEAERGKLLWNLKELPFPLAQDNEELEYKVLEFDNGSYQTELLDFFRLTQMEEDGKAAERVADKIKELTKNE